MAYDFSKEAQEHSQGGGDTEWFKPVEGDNKVRVLLGGTVIAEHFRAGVCYGKDNGCKTCLAGDAETNPENKQNYRPTVKWLFWIIDRKDGKIKLYKLGSKLMKAIGALQKNSDYAFEEPPMPYDITINVKNAGTKEAEYQVMPSPRFTELTEEEKTTLEKKHTTETIVTSMKKKQAKKEGNEYGSTDEVSEDVQYPEEDPNPDDIPF